MSVITLYAVAAVAFMMVMYALEGRGCGFILGVGRRLSAVEPLRIPLGRLAVRRRRVHLGGSRGSPLPCRRQRQRR